MAGMAFIIGLSIFEDEAVGTLQAIGTLFHTIWTILEMKAFHTMLWALQEVRKKSTVFEMYILILKTVQ